MDVETRIFGLPEPFKSPPSPRCSHSSTSFGDLFSNDAKILNLTPTTAINSSDIEISLFKSLLEDDKAQFIAHSKRFFARGDSTLDRSLVPKLLQICCAHDAVYCSTSLVNGDLGTVPFVNEVDTLTGLTPLHAAAEAHASRCVDLLLKRRARTDLRSRDGRGLLALELSLSSRRCGPTDKQIKTPQKDQLDLIWQSGSSVLALLLMDVIWNPDDYSVEDLVVLLREKDLTAVKLIAEKTKEIDEVAYTYAMGGQIASLAALLIVAAGKVNEVTLVLHGDNMVSKQKRTIYECVIREALSLALVTTSSLKASNRTCTPAHDDSTRKRKLLLCEIELLQLFGAVARSSSMDEKLTSPLIRATQAGDAAVIQLLLKTSIDVNETDSEGNTALHWSVKMSRESRFEQTSILLLLVKHGARVSQRNKLGLTAFHFAAATGNPEALEVLLLENPDGANSNTEMEETPLFFAVKNDHMDCAELLLRWGANSEVLNLRRQRPIDLAKSQDMRFMLNPANISLMNRTSQLQSHVDDITSETCDTLVTMTGEANSTERNFSSAKVEICKYFGSPSGCVRGSKCFYAHGEEELRQNKQEAKLVHCPDGLELKQKIFVRGLPLSLDSESLVKFFEKQFGFVEDAMVMQIQTGNHRECQRFGFVTFKHEKSVSEAIRARCLTIMDKEVEIKGAIHKSQLLNEFQKLSFQKYEKGQIDMYKARAQASKEKTRAETPSWNNKEGAKTENNSWVDRLFHGQAKASSTEFQPRGCEDRSMPAWLKTFRNWLPCILKEVSKHGRESEYPLSSLKGDFRAAFGLELDHVSLGYQKLSDFMRCFPDLCRMKIVPIGSRGPATHMILLPSLSEPQEELGQSFIMKSPSSAVQKGNNEAGDSKCLQEPLSVSSENFSFNTSSPEDGNPSQEIYDENAARNDITPSGYSRFLQFLKPDPIFHGRPWLYNAGAGDDDNAGAGDDDNGEVEAYKARKIKDQERHLVLEALARRKNKSIFFLREFDFYHSYDKSMEQRQCLWCKQSELMWANFPCQCKLWCSACKSQAVQAAAGFKHKCVVCDLEVQKLIFISPKRYYGFQPESEDVLKSKEFPPRDPARYRSR